MPYSLEKKLVISVASSALFDLGKANDIFNNKGSQAYKKYQEKHVHDILSPGVAFPFIRRLLNLNKIFPVEQPVEIILLSRNSPETGLRVFNSIKAHNLAISRAAFFSGDSPYEYVPAFNATIFLTQNKDDVKKAVNSGFPAGLVINSTFNDDSGDELRIAFDFDGVLADDEAEKIYQKSGELSKFYDHEEIKKWQPLNPGLLKPLLDKISFFQKLEKKREKKDKSYKRILKTSIVTARDAPAHERLIYTLKSWGIEIDNAFFLGGIEKKNILEVLKPHIYFDDQQKHLTSTKIPQVHIPFGIINAENIKS